MVCASATICAAATMGSTPFHGCAPWLCRPRTVKRKVSELAMAPPARSATVPPAARSHHVHASTASGVKSRNTPSFTISGAPPSSPLWAGLLRPAGTRTSPRPPDPCAALHPGRWPGPASWRCNGRRGLSVHDAHGPAVVLGAHLRGEGGTTSSVTGSASMSARMASRGPGLPPLSTPTTPVWATPVRTVRPSFFSCAATSAAVRVSWLPSSGCWCKSRRRAVICLSRVGSIDAVSAAPAIPAATIRARTGGAWRISGRGAPC